MSGAGSFVAGTIEDILLAIGQGIRDAQDRLNQLEPFDEYGRPRPQYYLPQLDFTLKINAVETSTSESGPEQRSRLRTFAAAESEAIAFAGFRAMPINFALASPGRTSSSSTSEVYSTISGRFVAVPPNDGMPQVALAIAASAHPDGGRKRTISVTSSHAAGEPVVGASVEFNVDPVSTAALNQLPGAVTVDHVRFFESGAVATDAAGVARTAVDFAVVPAGVSRLLVVANLGPVRASLLISETP
jgi:hypothetical protein